MRTGALEVIGAQATAPGTTLTNVTVNTGNSLTVRNSPQNAYLLAAWTKMQGTAGRLRIVSPRIHDNVIGISPRASATAGVVLNLLSRYPQLLISQDNLTVQLAGSATAGDIEIVGLLAYYPNLPGSNAVLINPAELSQFGTGMLMTFENTLATGTAGDWSGTEAINAEEDQFKANRWYAILGYVIQGGPVGSVRYVGPDFGNLGVGGPGSDVDKFETRSWFLDMSTYFGLPLIPCFNAANKGATTVSAHTDENGADPIVSTICALLAEGFDPDKLV